MMMCDSDDDATGDGRVPSNGATGNVGDVDAISDEGFLPRGRGRSRCKCRCSFGRSSRRQDEGEHPGRLSSLSEDR